MWAWMKRFAGTRQRPALEEALLAQQKLIERMAEGQREIISQQQATLDRIVTARFERPLERTVHDLPDNALPEWGMTDQSEVRPPASGIGRGIEALHVDRDADFLEAAD
jgi:hypothetical protein